MQNVPNRIYLQTGLEDNGETCSDFEELDMVSWCADKIYSDDLEFISVSFISHRIKKLETELNDENSIYSEASCRFRVDELKKLIE